MDIPLRHNLKHFYLKQNTRVLTLFRIKYKGRKAQNIASVRLVFNETCLTVNLKLEMSELKVPTRGLYSYLKHQLLSFNEYTLYFETLLKHKIFYNINQ